MKRTHKQGDPINPVSRKTGRGEYIKDGLDEIAYFAAHAPAEIPYWFKVDPLVRPEAPQPAPEIENEARLWDGTWDFAQSFDEYEIPGETIPGPGGLPVLAPKPKNWIGYRELAEKYENAYNAWIETCRELDLKDTERRYFQWRWYYGEQMMEHRGRD